uniref:Uncharacterized protein n=1 Tax=Oryza sativa subsp. japonica TaxID=39947 RepID=Q10HK0_ORYSJ|nr:hypothetical protein LOC_Os03g38864 [Oryza sativa Japonica Group]
MARDLRAAVEVANGLKQITCPSFVGATLSFYMNTIFKMVNGVFLRNILFKIFFKNQINLLLRHLSRNEWDLRVSHKIR